MTDHDDVKIEYTVKELLAAIKKEQHESFTRIETSMLGKADKADVARLEERLAGHHRRLDSHEQTLSELQQAERDRGTTTRVKVEHTQRVWSTARKIWTGIAGTITLGAVIAAPFISHYGI